MPKLLIYLPLLTLVASTSLSQQVDKASKESFVVHEHKANVVFDQQIPTNWRSNVTLDPLPNGKSVRISIPLLNNSPDSLTIVKGVTDCSCADATLRDVTWNSDKINLLVLELRTPKKLVDSVFASQIVFDAKSTDPLNPKVQLQIKVNVPLLGLFNFREPTYPLRLTGSEKEVQFEIPFVCTVPSPKVEVHFDGDPIFLEVKSDTTSSDSKLFLLVASDLIGSDGVFGQLTITDSVSGMSDKATLLIDRPKKVVVSPHTIRFSIGEKMLSGHAIVRINPEQGVLEELSSKKTVLAPAIIECTIPGLHVESRVNRLSTYIYRVELAIAITDEFSVPKLQDSLKSKNIVWQVRFGDEDIQVSTQCSVTRQEVSVSD